MTRGHPDFYTPVWPGMPVIGEGQTAWRETDNGLIAGGGFDQFIQYTVPTGKELHVMSGIVSCYPPGTHMYYFQQGEVSPQEVFGRITFDTEHIFSFMPGAGLIIPGDDYFAVTIESFDTEDATFYITMIGYLEDKT